MFIYMKYSFVCVIKNTAVLHDCQKQSQIQQQTFLILNQFISFIAFLCQILTTRWQKKSQINKRLCWCWTKQRKILIRSQICGSVVHRTSLKRWKSRYFDRQMQERKMDQDRWIKLPKRSTMDWSTRRLHFTDRSQNWLVCPSY